MRVRILEALAAGTPVVTTTMGMEGIEAIPDRDLLVADEPAAFASAVARILRDSGLGKELALNGRRLVEAKYDWRAVLPRLEAVYSQLLFAR
jgi:glycosyltransferase involved in cell wall biosynthesis